MGSTKIYLQLFFQNYLFSSLKPSAVPKNDNLSTKTLFHVATSYGVSEPTASRIVHHVEDCLIKSNLFNLPKHLPEGEGIDWNVVIVDATEIPIQRPKKTEEKL